MKVENKTIIITDPCYIIKEYSGGPEFSKWPGLEGLEASTQFKYYTEDQLKAYKLYKEAITKWDSEHDDWSKCDYGENMEALGINNYLTKDNMYGDWSCTTYAKSGKKLGRFCADAGLVSVFILDEVREYNPNIDSWIKEHPWCVTVIKDFTGDVEIKKVHIYGIYESDGPCYSEDGSLLYKKGDHWETDEIRVIGTGSVNFYTTQTGA